MEFPGIDGFLGTRASLMLDVVFVAMFAVIPVMGVSIAMARYKQRWQLHKTIQLTLATVLLVAVVAFEVDMQFVTDWELRAEPSPYFTMDHKWSSPVGVSLLIHLFFAVPTAFIWVYVVSGAVNRFPQPPTPSDYSARHKLWGRIAAIEMTMTAITGWVFYYLAFVA
ncbi:DUF420 domain-containing protein [Aeoliella sp.]|uniref:DUF420 domain-containing protein n=1 Tax=Aeoliella sp. TaxID=2795800 RepID=UPI003CCB7788